MIAVRMMEVAADAVIDMVGMRNRLVAAAGTMDMTGVVAAAAMVRRAAVGVVAGHLDHVLVDMILMRMVEVAIVQIVDMTAVAHSGVATTRPMLVSMVGMGRRSAGRHGVISFPYPRSADTALRSSAAWSIALLSIAGKCPSASV
jgi:hypothetical protein